MRNLPQPAAEDIEFVAVMHALSDPVRLRLLVALDDDADHTCTAAAEGIDVHKSTTSHHYRVLRESGIISSRQEGRLRLVRLRREELNARFPGVLDAALAAGYAELEAAADK
ncbi:ArsR/SmtB family transcription factor [Nocardia huaxiensis]|uniref:Helix-turn-helix transcriptional regulator n=1 Tax=Nocardia huaxiensis TaxID=2755382 RepID=A0A7D6Z0Y5_9NOCA|nr:helix-turn-helix domain-containing protein [Nocardia huaxiensis]QLY29746.1 helix-turn-helix transcriptional regulator [Nocardia huaxiensis]UFS96668.1 helix-turn-helix domain-containing protein [Nocardia huaxiensis]